MSDKNCKICKSRSTLFVENIFDDRHGYSGRFDIYRCENCGFGQTVPELPEEKIAEVYTEYYPRSRAVDIEELKKQPLNAVEMGRVGRWWAGIDNTAHYHIKPGTKVLDIGCGDCTSIREIEAMGARGHGIEPDQNIKSIVNALDLKVHVGLFHEIDYPKSSFDYITMSQVLEHVHRPKKLLKSLLPLLKENGQIILGVPNVDSRLRKKYRKCWLNWHVPYHINHFSASSVLILAKQCGYRVHKLRTITPNLWVELQKKLYAFPVAEGVKVPFFNNENESFSANEKAGKRAFLLNKLKNLKNRRPLKFAIFSVSLLRLCDIFGQGESLLAFLEKER